MSDRAPVIDDVRIIVSCHKPSFVPASALYLPVQVGASRTDARLPGCQPDDEGENISGLNGLFCELTAQYWAWKNLDKPFVGACHYRRYFCFDGASYEANDHAQIERQKLNEAAVDEFSLTDEGLILAALEDSDAIVPPTWSVMGVPTPNGPRGSIVEHMKAYDLLDDEAIELLDALVAEHQPDYLQDLRDYLTGADYIGYNCFVLRRPLFDRLNEFEFSVLLPFAEEYERRGLTESSARLYGYLGEIMFSTFITHIRREGGARIQEMPLTFFFDTDPFSDAPAAGTQGGLLRRLFPYGTRRGTLVRKIAAKAGVSR